MKNGKYEHLRDQYPAELSLDHLHKICHISKRSASYLVANGIIKATDTGKKTWRYRIAIDDVIAYLYKRDIVGSMIPSGSVSSRGRREKNPRKAYSDYVESGAITDLEEYFGFIYADYPDILAVSEAAEMTGLCNGTILKHIRSGSIMAFLLDAKYAIQKQSIISFLSSQSFIQCKSNSEFIGKLMRGFEFWSKNRKTTSRKGRNNK